MESDSDSEKGPTIDLQSYYHAVRDRIWIVLVAAAIGTVIAILLLRRSETFYQAQSVLLFSDQQMRVLNNVESVSADELSSVEMINTVVSVLESTPFALRVVERLHLDSNPDFLQSVQSNENKIAPESAALQLKSMVRASYRGGTRLLDVTVTNRNPDLAKLIANATSNEYLHYVMDKRVNQTRKAGEFLKNEAENLSKNLHAAELKLQQFRERERTSSLEALQAEAQTRLDFVSQRITSLEQSLQQLQTDIVAARENPGATDEMLRLPSVVNQPKIASLNALISERERELGVLALRYRAKHPNYIAARTALDLTIAERTRALKDVIPALEATEKQTKAQLDQAEMTRVEAEKRMVAVTGKAIEYRDLTRQVQTNQTFYNAILESLRQVDIAKNMSTIPMEVYELATTASTAPPPTLKFLILGIFGGAFAGVAIIIAFHAIDQSIKTVDEAEAITGLEVIGTIPVVDERKHPVDLAVAKNRNGVVAESFRTLRTALTVSSHEDEERRVFIFTSALPGEGKTFCGTNFAITLAQRELRTLIIDADLREPAVSKLFFKEHRSPGLTDVLSGKTPWREAPTATNIPCLTVLTAGEQVVNPSELLASRAFGKLIEELLVDFDRIVIDSAPCLAVSDTRLLLPYADACCFVVGALSTPRSAVKRAIRTIVHTDTQPVGIVLNRLPAGRAYYYSGAYGGPAVYGAAPDQKA